MPAEKHSMKGWGIKLSADEHEPRTREDATLLALMTCADRLGEMQVSFEEIKARLARIDRWLEANAPGYTRTSAYAPSRDLMGTDYGRVR